MDRKANAALPVQRAPAARSVRQVHREFRPIARRENPACRGRPISVEQLGFRAFRIPARPDRLAQKGVREREVKPTHKGRRDFRRETGP